MSASVLLELLQSRLTYVALIIIGAGLFGFFLYEDSALERVHGKYVVTPCTITTADVEERVTHGKGGTHRSYHFLVRYHYQVNGKTYTSTKFRHGDLGLSESEAMEVMDRYDIGAARCYVDPDAPQNAVLNQDSDMRTLHVVAMFGMLALLGGVGGWLFLEFVVYRESAKKPAEGDTDRPLEIPGWSALGKVPGERGA